MDSESVRSGRSERSERSQRSHASSRAYRKHSNRGSSRDRISERYRDRLRQQGGEHEDRQTTDMDTDRDDKSVTIKLPPSHPSRQHYNNQMALNGSRGGNHGGHPGGSQEPGGGDERIEVQILQQDDNWGETTTAITGNTSETAFSMEDMSRITKDMEESIGFNCARYIGSILAGIIGLFAFLSPIVMVVLPKIGIKEWTQKECGPECEGLFISFASKLLILFIGTWALFLRRPKATMPRIFIFRALILFLVFMLTFAFWLFYGVRIYDTSHDDYHSIVLYAVSLVDALLFIHYLAIILLEIRQLQPQYVVKMVRSPDGEARHYTCGQLSIQRMAVWCLEQYYKEFNVYNPYLEHTSRRTPKMPNFKFYDVDGTTQNTPATRSRAIFAAAARRRDTSHNDRFYEEQDYERRVRKRRARLLTAAEEAFTHIKRLHEEQGPAIPMDPMEAAQAIFPSMARALQKYLRITRQQPRYTMESILNHLAECVAHDMSPKSFLERYMTQGPVIWNDKDHKPTQMWILICDQMLSRAVEDGTLFQLRQGEVSLLCSIRKLPHFNLTEEFIDPKNNKFALRLNSETSV